MGPIPARAVAQSGSKKDVIRKPEFVEVAPPHISKEVKKRWSYFIRKVTKQILLSAPSAPAKCTSSATSTRVRSSIKFFNTWVYGRNPMPRRIEVPRREILFLTLKLPTVASAEPVSSPA